MSDISAPFGPAAGAAVGGASALVAMGEVSLSGLPGRLSQLSRAVTLSGVVTGQAADGSFTLRTQAGDVTFRTAAPLPPDATLTLQIAPGQPPTRAQAFLTGPSSPTLTPATLVLPTGADPARAPNPLNNPAKAALPGAGSGQDPLAPGTVLPGQMLTAPGRTAGVVPSQTQPAPVPAFPPGTTLAVRVLPGPIAGAVSEPDQMPLPDSALPDPRATVVSGTVVGNTGSGQTLLATPLGTLALATRAPVPPGRQVILELGDPGRMLAGRAPLAGAPEPLPAAPLWPALRETLAVLSTLEGGLAQSLLASVMPQPDRRLAATAAFMLHAIRRGDARGWLGAEATQALEKAGRHDVLAGLEREFSVMARDNPQTPGGVGWQTLAMPILDGGVIQRLELHTRPIQEDEEDGPHGAGGEPGHRFLVDLDLSRLGRLQLDGVVRSRSQRFDLILRSAAALPDPLRAELFAGFTESLEAVGYSGALVFHANPRGPARDTEKTRHVKGYGVVA